MYKRKREINALDLLKEISDFKKSKETRNKTKIYDTKTFNIEDYENMQNKEYNTKTMRTFNTSFKDFDSMNKEIKKKKNKGKLDLGSHGNKDIFIEVDSDQYDSGNNSKNLFNHQKNKCSKLLINKITPYVPDNYLKQNKINPYYSIKTYNNYNIKRPFNKNKKTNNIKKNIKNEIIPCESFEIVKSNNLSSPSNEIIKYPLVISLRNKNNFHGPKNSNLSNYLNDEINDDYFINISDNSNNNSYKEQNPLDKNYDAEQDYKMLYLMKKKQYNNLLNEYNDMRKELNKYKDDNNNYMINNFKKLNINNNKIKKNIKGTNKIVKESNKNNVLYKENKESFYISENSIQIKNDKEDSKIKNLLKKGKKENQYRINKTHDIKLISNKSNIKYFNDDKLVINKIKDFKIMSINLKNNPEQNILNTNNNLKIDNVININLIKPNKYIQNISHPNNNKYEINKCDIILYPKIKKKIDLENTSVISFCFQGNKNNISHNEIKENKKSNNISIDLTDILDEINSNNSTKLKANKNINSDNNKKPKKLNLNKFINKNNNNKSKEEIIENNIDRILNQNKTNGKDIKENNILRQVKYPRKGNTLINGETNDLPDLSYIRNKLHISIVKGKKINEDELN